MTTPSSSAVPPPIRWGILATGRIAHAFATDLALVPDAELVAVGSRSITSAQRFVEAHRAEHPGAAVYGSYAELVADPTVDVVYVASPHSLHLEHTRLALEAGKHVLCEKPVTLTAADAEEMVALAREHDRFLMEAMWTACHPVIRALVTGLREGRFGTPRHLHAELGFVVERDPDDRMLDPALGASALLDMGIYPLTFAHLVLGEATSLQATADLSERSIDRDVAIAGRYPGGALATMTASITSWSSRTASIATDTGRIELSDFHHPTSATFTPYGGASTNDDSALESVVAIEGAEPVIGRGYGNEIVEVGSCLRAGLRESPLVPHAQTLTLMRQLDTVRAQVGVVF
ncbi:MAG: Gfo/Idh/MocA family oxidoreductase [Nocardioides sp.]|nr:Gfo/Idh/MocA family oxidoreductase [Nocardioides sp.]